jgi:hypothetical protein
MTAEEWAASVGVNVRTVGRWLADGRVPGAVKAGRTWQIPAGTPAPFTTPPQNRPRGRTIVGEVVTAHEPRPVPSTAVQRWTPEAPLFTPEVPPLLTEREVWEAMGKRMTRESLRAMLVAGELRGVRRGKYRTWLIPYSEMRRLRGDGPA